MKRPEQITDYLSQYRFQDSDWSLICDYCQREHKITRLTRNHRATTNSDYHTFIEWVEKGFGSGDIVRYGHTLAIVAKSDAYCTALAAFIFDGKIITNQLDVPTRKVFRADSKQEYQFNTLMLKQNLTYAIPSHKVDLIYTPEKFSDVMIISNDGTEGVGIIEDITETECTFLIIKIGNELFQHFRISRVGLTVSKTDPKNFRIFTKFLITNGLEYAPRTNTIKKINSRPRSGGKYWYLSDRFTIIAAEDKHTSVHDSRYASGNYFTSYTAALMFLQEIKELRGEYEKSQG